MQRTTKLIGAIGMLCIICIVTGGFVSAMLFNQLPSEKATISEGGYAETDITQVGGLTTKVSGHNKVTLQATFINNDQEAHSATITITLLDSNGDPVEISAIEISSEQTITDLAASATTTLTFVFHEDNIASLYETATVFIYQTS